MYCTTFPYFYIGNLDTDQRLYIIMNNIGVDLFRIKLLKRYPCSSKKELIEEEKREIRKYGNTQFLLNNTYKATTTPTLNSYIVPIKLPLQNPPYNIVQKKSYLIYTKERV
jgi:hypothetical protein